MRVTDELLDDVGATFVGRLTAIADRHHNAPMPLVCARPQCARHATWRLYAWVLTDQPEAELLKFKLCKSHAEGALISWRSGQLTAIGPRPIVRLSAGLDHDGLT